MLQNISQPELCNGMRLAVQKLMNNITEATILTGPFNDEDALIPRIPMISRGKLDNLYIYTEHGKTKNVVYPEAWLSSTISISGVTENIRTPPASSGFEPQAQIRTLRQSIFGPPESMVAGCTLYH
ncbi:hypothetical protein TNCV_2254531 [Trichonephila clavipes]|nr:hypothetical protein TNCV_2254531 [Trichonephila clavipes]